MKRFGRNLAMGLSLLSAFVVAPGGAEAALVATGTAAFGEPSGGASSPIFGGTLYAEVFDAGGGTFSRTLDSVAATAGDYTVALQAVMAPDGGGGAAVVSDITLSAYMLGSGDTGNPLSSFGPPPTGGGTLAGGGDPSYTASGTSARFSFGGLAEGATSTAFFFTHPKLDLTAGGSNTIPLGDVVAVLLGTTVGSSVNTSLVLTAVPEPVSALLVTSALAALLGLRRRVF